MFGQTGYRHLRWTTIYCPQNGDCDIHCGTMPSSQGACGWMNVFGQETTTSLTITSEHPHNNILIQTNIYCPPSDGITPNCIIDIKSGGVPSGWMESTNIYAIQGLNDVMITCNYSGNAFEDCYNSDDNPILHCMDNYNSSCELELVSGYSNWQCVGNDSDICNDYTSPPTSSPTLSPTIITESPSLSPTPQPITIVTDGGITNCNRAYVCSNIEILCLPGHNCTIQCFAHHACRQSTIICPPNNERCTVICRGIHACTGIIISLVYIFFIIYLLVTCI